jgi:hypothetical protein
VAIFANVCVFVFFNSRKMKSSQSLLPLFFLVCWIPQSRFFTVGEEEEELGA